MPSPDPTIRRRPASIAFRAGGVRRTGPARLGMRPGGPILMFTLILGLVTSGCSIAVPGGATPDPIRGSEPPAMSERPETAGTIASFDTCDDLLDHVQGHALDMVTPHGLGGGPWHWFEPGVDSAEGEDPAGGRRTPHTAPLTEGEDYSGTNTQEGGLDEPDVVKTDGRTLYVVRRSTLDVVDITGDQPVLLTSLPLPVWRGVELLLHDDRLLVTSPSGGAIPFGSRRGAGGADDPDASDETSLPRHSGSTLTSIDVSDPADPVVQERLTVDGRVVDARMVDGVVRLVVRTDAGIDLPWASPPNRSLRGERIARDHNRRIIEDSDVADWLPHYVHETHDGRLDEGDLLPCDRVAIPETFAGLDVLSVLTVDLAQGSLAPGPEATALLSSGSTVYASPQRLYVATTPWVDGDRMDELHREERFVELGTEVHAFDIADPRATDHLGSGEVPGLLLNQWAMSEHDGHLRVASTTGNPLARDAREASESLVTVLEVDDGALTPVGQVDGLGVTETISAVRFMGDVGYVVTFRETDPLYTLDLRDPTAPQVLGELEIPGYSGYLHPIGDELLLGVGQDATPSGQILGTQVSLFDVSDPTAPTLLDQVDLPSTSSRVEGDHHAFLHWPATGLTAVPYERWHDWSKADPDKIQPMIGVLAFTASRDHGIVEPSVLSHIGPYLRDLGFHDIEVAEGGPLTDGGDGTQDPGVVEEPTWRYQRETRIVRSLVVPDRLVTVSDAGVATHDLDTLDERGWLTFETEGRRS